MQKEEIQESRIQEDIKIAVLRIEGTNCEDETVRAFRELGVFAEAIHLKQLYSDMIRDDEKRRLADYSGIVFPGGFSAGDYVRAGAIFSARVKSVLRKDLEDFIMNDYPILGICNGFQILVELGALPGFDEDRPLAETPEMVLAINNSNRFECRQSLLKHENKGKCIFTKNLGEQIVMFPVAHAEGKVTFPASAEKAYLERLIDNDQMVFRYVNEDGEYAGYPWNPNGSVYNIAGICNVKGNVFGLMPHPERAFFAWNHLDYPRNEIDDYGEGRLIFQSMIDYIRKLK
ncbi:MAG: phosphoribosylformylglycinamidine synthase subunit PurQ [Archaeoglobus sp.]|nr:phosphoribosylformylglycinamidine synthase subunit PurQ [Archaeoglobus sp.]